MLRIATYTLLIGSLLPAPLWAQGQIGGGGVPPAPRITAPSVGGGGGVGGIQPSAVGAAPVINQGNLGISAGGVDAGVGVQSTAIGVQRIGRNSEFNFNRHKTSVPVDRKFDYSRYNRFSRGGAAPTDKPRVAEKPSIYREENERAIRVQSLNPSLDGYEITNGYTYAPDMNEDNWIWLPLGAR